MTACLSYCMTASRIYEAGASYVRYFDLTLMFGMKLECNVPAPANQFFFDFLKVYNESGKVKKSLDPFFHEDIAI